MNVSQYVAQYLKSAGVDVIFELSGGMIMHLIDAIHQTDGLRLINVYHEQAAAFAADAVGRISGRPGVALGTSGPGAINLLTGVGSCYFDSSPAVFITGQVNRHEQKGSRAIRQLGFQETDIVSMAAPITKWAARINDAAEVPAALDRAFRLAVEGRPGSVLLDIPMDVFRSQVPESESSTFQETARTTSSLRMAVADLEAALAGSQRPLILAGGGVRASGAHSSFRRLVDLTGIPVVNSLLACDVLPFGHPLHAGMIGTYGNRWSNLAISESDLMLVLGSRLDIRQTGADTEGFQRGRRIFHVDAEEQEINNRVRNCQAIHADLKDFLQVAAERLRATPRPDWLQRIESLRQQWPDVLELKDIRGINPNTFMHALSTTRAPAAYCVDVGLHQMWAAQSLELPDNTRFLTSGGMGAMGFSLPAAIGAAFQTYLKQPVVVVAGDGGFQLNIQELQTVVHHQLPVKIVVMNNHCHGMTRQFQDTYFSARHVGTVWGYSTPSFAAIGQSYGLDSRNISDPSEVAGAVDWFWNDPLTPCLLEVQVDVQTNAYPKLAFGRPISEMEPLAKPIEMEGT
jgi:acetolactate synthase-1/2/3 large subunit